MLKIGNDTPCPIALGEYGQDTGVQHLAERGETVEYFESGRSANRRTLCTGTVDYRFASDNR